MVVSRSQQQVASALDEMGVKYQMEVSPFEKEVGEIKFSAMLNIDMTICKEKDEGKEEGKGGEEGGRASRLIGKEWTREKLPLSSTDRAIT